ncbi:MAG TPA: hypothetical protein DCP92_01975 [Nitrospiraceae bacterium]|nr:hypothetical protein [Nitrospiraceae bacterium]
MNIRLFFAALPLLCLFASFAGAQGNPIIYPAKGQSDKQMEKDKYDCYTWAKKQTGFDPMQAQQAPPPSSKGPTGEVVKGAAVGAVGGVAIGAIAGNAGKGAAIGAASGALIGGVRKHKKQQQQEESQQQQAAAVAAGRSEYNRAFGACLEGRGYTVK